MSVLTSQDGSEVLIGETSNDQRQNDLAEAPCTHPIVNHPEFFFENTMVAIQVENTMFNLHKYQLAKSEVFMKIFETPEQENSKPRAGSSPEHPITIHGASASDFAALLRILYTSHFSVNPPAPEAALIVPAFRLVNLLGFSELRAYLLPLAEKNLDDVDKIAFSREFNILEWLVPAYIRICKRESVLDAEEARKLDVDSILLIWRMREKYRSQNGITMITGEYYCSTCSGMAISGPLGGTTCKQCNNHATRLCYNGPSVTWVKVAANDSTLEAEVKEWVENSYSTTR